MLGNQISSPLPLELPDSEPFNHELLDMGSGEFNVSRFLIDLSRPFSICYLLFVQIRIRIKYKTTSTELKDIEVKNHESLGMGSVGLNFFEVPYRSLSPLFRRCVCATTNPESYKLILQKKNFPWPNRSRKKTTRQSESSCTWNKKATTGTSPN